MGLNLACTVKKRKLHLNENCRKTKEWHQKERKKRVILGENTYWEKTHLQLDQGSIFVNFQVL